MVYSVYVYYNLTFPFVNQLGKNKKGRMDRP